jgi:COP9 signalosome complex subunit 5
MPCIPIGPLVMDKILWLDSRIKLTDVTLHIFANSQSLLFVTMAADQGSVVQGGDPHPSTAPAPQQVPTAENARYSYDEEKLRKLKSDAPWMKNPKYFKAVAVGPTAVMKIMMHCQSGVDKGIAKGGNPIEVMGLLTRVVADDENVSNHMIALGDVLEITRKEHFMGWYHSHPFDLGENSHCFLSQTDLSTQLQWQRAEDPHGNPFVAIVVDPLRSLHTGTPELKAFRAYPPEYTSSQFGECPDGSVEAVEQQRLELWGSCWNRYYELVRTECSST